MGSANQLSFLPDDYLERKAQRRTNAICAILFLLVIGGIGAAFTLMENSSKQLDAEFAAVDQQYREEAKRLEQVKQMQDKQKRMAHQAELTASLLERVPRSTILAELTNALPAGVSLLDFTLDSKAQIKKAAEVTPKTAYEMKKAAKQATSAKDAAAATPAPPEPKTFDVFLKLTGVAPNDVQVAMYLNRLSRSPLLRDVNLVITDEYAQGDEKLRKFQIEMALSPDAEVQLKDAKNPQTTAVELKE